MKVALPLVLLSLSVAAVVASRSVPAQEGPIKMGKHRQLFVDDYVIAEMRGVSKVLNQPRRHPLNPVVTPDHPWEGAGLFSPGVRYDEKTGTFTMNYLANLAEYDRRVCRAVSKDGIHWEKPELGLVEYEGSKANNLVRRDPGKPRGLHTPWDPDPRKQYKMLAGRHGPGMFSPDGVHWETPPESKRVTNVASDSAAGVRHDESRRRYVAFAKTVSKSANHLRRCVGVAFSDDFLEWTTMKAVLATDARDDELARQRVAALRDRVTYLDGPEWHLAQFYAMDVVPYEGMYLGLLQVHDISGWRPGKERRPAAGGEDGPGYMELAVSRDMEHWSRVCDRDVFLPVGDAGTWEAGWVRTGEPIVRGDEIWIYYGGLQVTHATPWSHSAWGQAEHEAAVEKIRKKAEEKGKKHSGGAIGLATLRLDGWVSVDAGEEGGTLTTKPLLLEAGKQLAINAQTPRGSVVVEVLDAAGKPVAGFAAGNCDAFRGDAIRHVMTWDGKSSVSELADNPVRLRFHLQNAKLYSFAFGGDRREVR